MSRLVIVGAGDHGRVVLELLRAVGEQPDGFVEPSHAEGIGQRTVDGVAVVGDLDDCTDWLEPDTRFVAALGDNRARQAAYRRATDLGMAPVVAVHPTARLLTGAVVEPGAMVCAGAVVGVAARVEANAIVNTAASVDHDNRIGQHATVAPGAHLAGRVSLGEGAFVGIGSAVREGCSVGAWAFVAGGAMVTEDVPPGARVAGVPARPMGS
jgi:sugar O-acyltransferase (sialic acid O-acetyltransferase NeuD family)